MNDLELLKYELENEKRWNKGLHEFLNESHKQFYSVVRSFWIMFTYAVVMTILFLYIAYTK